MTDLKVGEPTFRTGDLMAVERQFWRTSGAKDDAIRALGLSVTRYYQLVAAWIQTDAALAADPVLVKRLRRIART